MVLPKGLFTRRLAQLRLLDKQLRHEYPLQLFPVKLKKIDAIDYDLSHAASVIWNVNRCLRWLLSKPVALESPLLAQFLTEPAFGVGFGSFALSEFKQILEGFRRFFGSPEASFNVTLQNRIPDADLDDLTALVTEVNDRLALIEGLQSAYEANLAWRRYHGKALEDVARSISELSRIPVGEANETVEAADSFHQRVTALRDLTDASAGRVYDSIALILRLQAMETQNALAFLHFWPRRLKELDDAITASLNLDAGDSALVDEGMRRVQLCALCFAEAREACRAELAWFLQQGDDEVAFAIDAIAAIEAETGRSKLKILQST